MGKIKWYTAEELGRGMSPTVEHPSKAAAVAYMNARRQEKTRINRIGHTFIYTAKASK